VRAATRLDVREDVIAGTKLRVDEFVDAHPGLCMKHDFIFNATFRSVISEELNRPVQLVYCPNAL